MTFNKWCLASCTWASLLCAIVVVADHDPMGKPSSSSRRHKLDVNNSPFHRARRFLKTHSSTPDDFRKLTSQGVPTVEMDYGEPYPLEQNWHRRTQDRPEAAVNYPIGATADSDVPLRIYYLDDPIRSLLGTGIKLQDDYINYILDTVLPNATNLWDNHLKIYPASNNIPVSMDSCWGVYPAGVSEALVANGVPDADVGVFVSMQKNLTTGDGTLLNVCADPNTLVVSTFCVVEQYGRPLVGLINFCPPSYGKNKIFKARSLQQATYPKLVDNWQTSPPISNGTASINSNDLLVATTHQLGHILAMNYDLYRNFIEIDNGVAYTPVHSLQTVTCSDNSQRIALAPAINTLLRTQLPNGLVYFDLVLPRVKSVVQSHFNCPSAVGRLENDPSQVGCVASHFHQRLFLGEIMAHLSFETSFQISPTTLAVFANSGWYVVTFQDTYLPYGQGWGCDFFYGDCIVNDTVPDYGKGVYCSTPTVVESDGSISLDNNDIYCDPLHQRWAVCDLFDQKQVPSGFGNLNASRSWFSNTNLLSSSDGFDSCPLPILTLSVDCNDTTTSLGINYYGEAYGAASRCINAEIASTKRKLPACLNISCDSKNHQVVVSGIRCKYDGEVHTIKTINGEAASFECPRLSLVCPQLFCPSDCAGLGTCDYTQTPPRCNCTNPVNATLFCEPLNEFVTSPSVAPAAAHTKKPTRAPVSAASHKLTTTTVFWLMWGVSTTIFIWNLC